VVVGLCLAEVGVHGGGLGDRRGTVKASVLG
jgi:hypothetical protein